MVRAASAERFLLRLTDTGYGWYGAVGIQLEFLTGDPLALPWLRIAS